MKKDNVRLSIMAIITILVLVTSLFYGAESFKQGVSLGSALSLSAPLLVVAMMGYFIFSRYRDIKQGMPLEDERSKKVLTNAAATSFYVSLYWLLALAFISEKYSSFSPDPSTVIDVGVGGMGLIFFISWFYQEKKGRLN